MLSSRCNARSQCTVHPCGSPCLPPQPLMKETALGATQVGCLSLRKRSGTWFECYYTMAPPMGETFFPANCTAYTRPARGFLLTVPAVASTGANPAHAARELSFSAYFQLPPPADPFDRLRTSACASAGPGRQWQAAPSSRAREPPRARQDSSAGSCWTTRRSPDHRQSGRC